MLETLLIWTIAVAVSIVAQTMGGATVFHQHFPGMMPMESGA